MRATHHLVERFSDAVDGRLDHAGRGAFDAHLAVCDACATSFAEFEQTIAMVRELPRATMPWAVRLPEGAPLPERRALASRWRERVQAASHPLWRWVAIPAAGAAALAVVVAALFIHSGQRDVQSGSPGTAALAVPTAGSVDGSASRYCGSSCSKGATVPSSAGCSVHVVQLSPDAPRPSAPASFADSVTQSSPLRPGAALTLATVAAQYSPGAVVPVYARLTARDAHGAQTTALPCVTLGSTSAGLSGTPRAAPAPAGAPPQQYFGDPGSGYALPASIAGGVEGSDGLPLLDVTIPATVPHGTVLVITATVPGGSPADASAAITATLMITVT